MGHHGDVLVGEVMLSAAVIARYKAIRAFNKNHDPDSGQFAESGGSGSPELDKFRGGAFTKTFGTTREHSWREQDKKIRESLGLPSTAKIKVVPGYQYDRKAKQMGPGSRLFVEAEADDWHATRILERTPKGLVVHNDIFVIKKASQGSGLGTKLFAEQVEAYQKAGVTKIVATLSGDDHHDENGKLFRMNGYYTWARLGYNAKIPIRLQKKLTKELGPKAKVGTLHELMKNKKGREAWKKHGETIEGEFDLSKKSKAVKVLKRYMAEKAKESTKGKKIAAAAPEEYDLAGMGPDELDEELLDRIWEEEE